MGKQTLGTKIMAAGIFALTAGLAQAGSYVHIGEVAGLDVQTQFDGYADINGQGEYLFPQTAPVNYRVKVINRGPTTVSNVRLQSSLHSDGHQCGEEHAFPGSPLPGPSVSPEHTVTLSPGQTYDFEAQYAAPDSLCALSAHLKVRLQYQQYGRVLSSNLISQTHVELSK